MPFLSLPRPFFDIKENVTCKIKVKELVFGSSPSLSDTHPELPGIRTACSGRKYFTRFLVVIGLDAIFCMRRTLTYCSWKDGWLIAFVLWW
jgi:hypothetical protein